MVIGLGSMGKRRIRLIRDMNPQYNLIGVDTNTSRVMDIKKEYNMKCYVSIDEAIENHKLEVAFVCTSPVSHADIINQCLHNGLNVFSEINLVADRYEENVELAKEKGLILFLSSTPIYRDEMKIITEKISAEKNLSYIYHVGQYLPDWHPWEGYKDFFVGDSRTNGCREIMAIELPWMVKAFGSIRSIKVSSGRATALNIDYPDNYMIIIEHTNGNRGTFIVDVVARKPVRHLEVYNENNYIEWSGTPSSLLVWDKDINSMKQIDTLAFNHAKGYSLFINELAYVNEIREFEQVLQGKEPEYTMSMDKRIIEWIDLIEDWKE